MSSMLAFTEPGPEPDSTTDFSVLVKGGEIVVRVFAPHGTGPFPAHLYIHGGGWWIGTIDHFASNCREFVQTLLAWSYPSAIASLRNTNSRPRLRIATQRFCGCSEMR